MKIFTRLFFISLSIVSLAPSLGSVDTAKVETTQSPAVFTEFFVMNKEVLKRLVPLVQHYAQLIKNNRIKVSDPVSALAWCQELSTIVGMLLREPQPVLDVNVVAKFTFMVDSLITMVQTASRNNFSQLPPLSPEILMAQATPRGISANKLSTYVQGLTTSINELEKDALQKGFTWYNRAYRGLGNFCDRYYISALVKKTTSLAYISTFLGVWGTISYYQWLSDEDRKFLWGVNINNEDPNELNKQVLKLAANAQTQLSATLQANGASNGVVNGLKTEAVEKIMQQFYEGVKEIVTVRPMPYRGALFNNVTGLSDKENLKKAHLISIFAKLGVGALESIFLMDKAVDGFEKIDKKIGISETFSPILHALDAKLRGVDIQHMSDLTYVHNISLDDPRFAFIRPLLKVFEQILEYVRDPMRFVSCGLKIPKKIMITGGSGQGKTLVAEALCGSLNQQAAQSQQRKFAFLRIEPHQLFAWGENAVSRIMAEARQHAPCVVYIDEIHALNLQVDGNSKLMTEWLMALDELERNDDPDHQIILIASTNKENLLDSAMLRDGRFDERIHLDAPSKEERAFMINTFCRLNAVDTINLNIDLLASITAGASRSTMTKICEKASSLAKMENALISFDHFYQAINKISRKIQLQSRLTEDEKWQLAVYQAGVALTILLKQNHVTLDAVTIKGCLAEVIEKYDRQVKFEGGEKERIEYGKVFTYKTSEQKGLVSYAEQKEDVKVLLAGSAAQKIVLGSTTHYRIEDRNNAINTLQTIELNGLKLENLSEKRQNEVKDHACQEIATLDQEMEIFLKEHKEELLAIAKELQIKEFLTIDEIKSLMAKN